jgi:hypothetical protein
MIRLMTQDGYFLHPVTAKAELSIEGILTDSGTLSRNFYGVDQKLQCWSLDSQYPPPRS